MLNDFPYLASYENLLLYYKDSETGERIVVKVQTLNLLKRFMSGNSLASVFYWTIYKRGDTEGKTLMGRSHTILKQYGLTLIKAIFNDVFRINNTSVIYEQYSYGQNGLVDSLRAIFNDFTF